MFTARPNLPINALWERGILAGLQAEFPGSVAIESEYVDFDRLQTPQYRELWLDLLRVKYAEDPPDIVVPVHDLAAQYVAMCQPEIFPDAEIVFCSVSEDVLPGISLTPRMTGITYRLEFQRTVELASQLCPTAQQVVVVSGVSEMDAALLQAAQSRLTGQVRQTLIYWTGLPLEELCAKASELDDSHVILFLSYEKDRAGRMSISSRDALETLTAAAAVPTFALYDSLLGAGVVGGQMAQVEEQGQEAGEIVARLLKGETPQKIEFAGSGMTRPLFDWRALKRWGIPEQQLPRDYELRFRSPTTWEQYGPALMLAGAVVGLQSVLIIGLLLNHQRRRLVQAKLQEMLRFQTTLAEVSSTLVEHSFYVFPETLQTVIRQFVESVGADSCSVFRLVNGHLELAARVSRDPQELGSGPPLSIDSIYGLWSRVMLGDRVVFSTLAELDAADSEARKVLFSPGTTAGIVCSLRENHQWLGLLVLGVREPTKSAIEQIQDRGAILADLLSQYIARVNAFQLIASSRSEARRLAGDLLTAQEDERRRISLEIHDDICQRLVAVGMQIQVLEGQVEEPPSAVDILQRLTKALGTVSRDVQHLARRLHPAILEQLGLPDAIRAECRRLEEVGKVQIDFRCLPLPTAIEKNVALCLYRITQEAVWNVVKHAAANHATVQLSSDAEAFYLEITDNGRGFDIEKRQAGRGLGLKSFKERVRPFGGTVEIVSSSQLGTKVRVRLPIQETKI